MLRQQGMAHENPAALLRTVLMTQIVHALTPATLNKLEATSFGNEALNLALELYIQQRWMVHENPVELSHVHILVRANSFDLRNAV